MIRVLGAFCASTGSFIDLEFGLYCGKGQGEPNLLLKMLDRLKNYDLLVLDRYFSGFELMGTLIDKKLNFIVRLKDQRAKKIIKSKGIQRDGKITLTSKEVHSASKAYEKITIRIIRFIAKRKGYRSKEIFVATTLFKENISNISEIYKKRWGVEVALRNIKCTMGLGFIKAKSPDSVKKQLWASMIAYNFIISVMSKTKKKYPIKKRIHYPLKRLRPF